MTSSTPNCAASARTWSATSSAVPSSQGSVTASKAGCGIGSGSSSASSTVSSGRIRSGPGACRLAIIRWNGSASRSASSRESATTALTVRKVRGSPGPAKLDR